MASKVSGSTKRQQRTIRVFYSSPFRGLEREREMLSGVYWPRVGQACAQRGFTFVPIDFRWGITEESSSAANTVSICLNEVSRADLFVGFFGARYGWHGTQDSSLQLAIDKALPQYPWLKQYRDRSVTEMEFLEARLCHYTNSTATSSSSTESKGDPDSSSTSAAPDKRARPAAFLFRDPTYDAEMFQKLEQAGDPKEAAIYTAEIDGPNAPMLLKNLKDQVEKHAEEVNKMSQNEKVERKEHQLDYCSVLYYKTPQEGARLMFEETMSMLNKFFLNTEQEQTQSKFDTWVEGQAAFMATQHTLGSKFLGRVEEQRFLGELLDNDDNWRLILKGEEGCGKSALVINHLHQKEELNLKSPRSNLGNSIDIYYSMSAYPGANSSLACLQFLAASLEQFKQNDENQNESGPKVKSDNALRLSKIGDLLERITAACLFLKEWQQKSVHFFLDGIDRIDSQKTTDIPLGFLPKRLPLKQIVSTKSTDVFHLPAIEEGELIKTLNLEKFKTHEAMEAVDSALKVRGKSLNEFCLKTIIQCEQICNFLFLKVLLDQLFSHAQFSSLETEVTDLCNCSSVSEIFVLFLDKVEIVMGYEGTGGVGEDDTSDGKRVTSAGVKYRSGSAGEALCLLTLSSQGLMETEVMEMVGWESRLWATFFSTVRPTLLDNGSQVYSIYYTQLKEAVERRYLNSEEHIIQSRTQLANYFWEKFQQHRKSNPFQKSNVKVPDRIIQELPPALSAAGMFDKLRECLLDVNFFHTVSRGLSKSNSSEHTATSMEMFTYAKYLKSAAGDDDFKELVKEFTRNVEKDIVLESSRRYGRMQRPNEGRIDMVAVVLSNFYDFLDEGIGMPGVGVDLLKTAIVIQRAVLHKFRLKGDTEKAIKEEIYLSEFFNRISIALSYQNEYDTSIGYLNKTLAIKRTHLHRKDLISDIESRVATTLHTLGNCYKGRKKLELAIPCFEEAVKMHKEHNSDQQWSSLDGLASCYFFQKNFVKAEELYRQVVDHYTETALTSTDNLIAGFICNLANAVRRNGRLDEARTLYQKSWAIQNKLLGDTHHSIAITLLCLGNLEMASKNFQDSVSYFEKAYAVYKKTMGLVCHETALAAENIAIAYSKMEDFENGTPWFHHGGELLEKLGVLHMTMPWMNRKYLRYHYRQGNQDQVDKILERMGKVDIDPGNYTE